MTRIRTILNIDSAFRSEGSPGNFVSTLDRRFDNVVSARVVGASIPKFISGLTSGNNVFRVMAKLNGGGSTAWYQIRIDPAGAPYTLDQMRTEINLAIVAAGNNINQFIVCDTPPAANDNYHISFSALPANAYAVDVDMFFSGNGSLADLLGFDGSEAAASPIFANRAFGQGASTRSVYVTCPEIFNADNFTSTSAVISNGLIAIIPVSYGEGSGGGVFNPTSEQTIKFEFSTPRSLDRISLTFFSTKVRTGGDPNFFTMEFDGHTVTVALEIEWFLGY